MDLPLGDIRVIDLTVARAGPTCARQPADWGADVIRVEPRRLQTRMKAGALLSSKSPGERPPL